ncbi:BnaC05g26760D [Brassica napus]|uniref:Uncharacterized protein n=2 Tax=Brassica TaxID=3705 RepID=A0A3P6F3P9_BRAOL|nr:unnamed protein product [Brassica napus]CDY07314.1 BnaC05g26760D [Brassica napus]VDD44526.1 unnamed protein product [Brassica oleracea]
MTIEFYPLNFTLCICLSGFQLMFLIWVSLFLELFVSVGRISPHLLEGVPDVLTKELFLASGEGPGLTNVNPLIRSVQELRGTDMRNLQRRGRIDR